MLAYLSELLQGECDDARGAASSRGEWTVPAPSSHSQRDAAFSVLDDQSTRHRQRTPIHHHAAMSGLFGNPPAATGSATSGGLFGNLGSNQPAAGASTAAAPKPLFATNTASPAPSGGLFGNLGASSSAAPASQTTTTSATGGGLFGGLGAPATSQPQSTGSLGGLFSKPAATQQTQGTQQPNTYSLFGGTQQAGAQQQTGGLGQSTLLGASTQPQQQTSATLSQSTAGTTRSAHFDHLLERSRKRNAGENGFGNFDELPTLQLGLGDIARKVRNLGQGGPSADQAQDRAA